jgi:hypothetical protein
MKKFLLSFALVLTLTLPALAQWHNRLSSSDQGKFDSYYSRWIQYRDTNNRDQIGSMEKRMQDLMARYRIPLNTPYWQVASNGSERDMRGHDDHGRDDHGHDHWQAQRSWNLSPDDQRKFDSYYSRWIDYQRTNNRDQAGSMEKRMRDLMARYRIPQDVPFSRVASQGQYH